MIKTFQYSQASTHDIPKIHELIFKVFNTFVAPLYSQEGIQEFYKYINIEEMTKRFDNNHFILVCKTDDKIIGLIEIRNNDHISMFFVDNNFQSKGIGKELLKKAVEACKINNPNLRNISVNSSPNATAIYEKLGFKKNDDEQIKNGIRFVPMTFNT